MQSTILSPETLLFIIVAYFFVLLGISWVTSSKATSSDFFIGSRSSKWWLVAFGMIGTSLSGVTFISIPGVVGSQGTNMNFSYMQIVLGYLLGYILIANVLLPLYYKLNLTSIYEYLGQRFGKISHRTGSAFFLISRLLGASFRLFLVVLVLDNFVLGVPPFELPFWATVSITIGLIWIYTFRGGIKTIVYTDTLQTTFMLLAVVLSIYTLSQNLDLHGFEWIKAIKESSYSQIFYWDDLFGNSNHFVKQFLSGALIALVMTGLDQDMMQKNLSCRNIIEAKTNMYSFSTALVFVNLLFLTLGAMLYLYAQQIQIQIPTKSDALFPTIALHHLDPSIGIVFILGLIAAAYSSADSALTALTTAFCVDFLNHHQLQNNNTKRQFNTRLLVHFGWSVALFVVIMLFHYLNDQAIINNLLKWAGLTYGPLLGLFSFGILTQRKLPNSYLITLVCIIAPILTYLFDQNNLFIGFKMGHLVILLNGILTFIGLWIISHKKTSPTKAFL